LDPTSKRGLRSFSGGFIFVREKMEAFLTNTQLVARKKKGRTWGWGEKGRVESGLKGTRTI